MITVIIPTYNRRAFLEKAVNSVLKQTYRNFELIIVDDGSNDGTGKLIQSFPDRRIRYFYQKNKGVSSSRNLGIAQSRGDIIAFLDSDDFWKANKLERQLSFMTNNLSLISHTQEIWYRRGDILNQKKKFRKNSGLLFDKSLEMCSISISTVMMRKSLLDTVGLFDESLPACEDYDIWLRITYRYSVHLLDEPLTVKNGGRQDQLSMKIPMLDRFRIQSISKLLRERSLDKDQRELAMKAMRNKCKIYINGCRKHGRKDEAIRYEEFLTKMVDEYSEKG